MTPKQQEILIYLAERTEATSAQITTALGFSPATFQREVIDLYDEDFVQKTKKGSTHVCRYFLTPDGASVAARLIQYRAHVGQIVQPRTIDRFAGRYTPAPGYQRECNNKQIKSVGFPC